MAGARTPERRPVHGRPGHRNRERCSTLDSGRPRVLAGEPAVGDQRVCARLRRIPVARRASGRPARAPARLPGGGGRLHARLALRWARMVRGLLDRARSLQGFGASIITPAALSILSTTFVEGRERNIALGVWGAVGGFGAAAGVLLGGILTDALSWEWIFFVQRPEWAWPRSCWRPSSSRRAATPA